MHFTDIKKFRRQDQLAQHLADEHKLQAAFREFQLLNEKAVSDWIDRVETEGVFKFVQARGIVKNDNSTLEYLRCFRSGNFVSESRGQHNTI